MAGLIAIQRSIFRKILPTINRRLVSTSKKANDTAAATVSETAKTEAKAVVEHKNWVHYGFDAKSKQADRNAMHSVMFACVTLCLVCGGYFLAYLPDYHLKDWAQREAFLELRRREKNGLPLVDPNVVNPAKIQLPIDDELENTEIII